MSGSAESSIIREPAVGVTYFTCLSRCDFRVSVLHPWRVPARSVEEICHRPIQKGVWPRVCLCYAHAGDLLLSLPRSLAPSRARSPSLSLSDTQPLTHTPKVWITDSCPMQAELVNGKGPFEVLSLAPLIASHIDLAPVEVGGGLAPRGLSRL